MSKITKKAIMSSFMKLLNNTSFDNITVKAIVDDCGISRNAFYYNFEDIYTLADEIMKEEINKITQRHQTYKSWKEGFMRSADFALRNKKAIFHLHNSSKRGQLEKYFRSAVYDAVAGFVEEEAKGADISGEDTEFTAEFYTYALLGFINKWIEGGMDDSFIPVINKTSLIFQSNIKQVIRLLEENKF